MGGRHLKFCFKKPVFFKRGHFLGTEGVLYYKKKVNSLEPKCIVMMLVSENDIPTAFLGSFE